MNNNLDKYFEFITDTLCGHGLRVASTTGELTPEAETEAAHLKDVWEMMQLLDPPEPDDVTMDRLYRNLLARAITDELDDDDLDLVVGAGKPQEHHDTTDEDLL